MGLYLIISVMFALGGLFHVVQIIWTMMHRDDLLKKYISRPVTHDAILKFDKPSRLIVTILCTLLAIASSVYLALSIEDKYGNHSAGILFSSGILGGLLAISIMIYTYFLLYREK